MKTAVKKERADVINIPKKIEKKLNSTSRDLGIPREDLLTNAFLYYLKNMKADIELKKELELWEKVSDYDLLKFEKSI